MLRNKPVTADRPAGVNEGVREIWLCSRGSGVTTCFSAPEIDHVDDLRFGRRLHLWGMIEAGVKYGGGRRPSYREFAAGGAVEYMAAEGVSGTQSHFGVHLTLDGYSGCPRRLGDFNLIEQALRELPQSLGMHQLAEPMVIEVGELSAKDPGGITGFVLIAESHISIHTFPECGFLSADVYTCQNSLECGKIVEFITRTFALGSVETNYLVRGKLYAEARQAGLKKLSLSN